MKRTPGLLAIASLLLLTSTEALRANPTTAEEAERAVIGWLSADPDPLVTPLGPVVNRTETFTDAVGRPLYHVVTLEPSGFVIVAADDQVEPILAFSAGGTYSPSPSDPLGVLVLNDLRQRMSAARLADAARPEPGQLSVAADPTRETPTQRKWRTLIDLAATPGGQIAIAGRPEEEIDDPRVDPLLEIEGIQWGQKTLSCGSACYNYFTPRVVDGEVLWREGQTDNYPSGCTATAMAQLMRFHRHPTDPIVRQELTVNVILDEVTEREVSVARWLRGGSGPGGRYDWDLMAPQPDCEPDNEWQRREIGALCFDAGLAAGATYALESTNAGMEDGKEALIEVFHYANAISSSCADCDMLVGLAEMVNPNLDGGKPVLLGVERSDADELVGHAIVCDGYGYNFSTLYHHLNMGWEMTDRSTHDIWYNLPDVNTPTLEYTVLRTCMYNVFPDTTGEIISGRVRHADGSPAAGILVRGQPLAGAGDYWDTTDARGIYALVGCDSDVEYSVWVEGLDYPADDSERRVVRTGTSTDGCSTTGNRWAVDFPAPPEGQGPQVVYVDADAGTGLGDGSSWAHAYTSLQKALSRIPPGFGGANAVEIWVAAGTYTPGAATEAGRNQSFHLRDGVAICGGFAGWEAQRDERDTDANPTILSGDLADNDVMVAGVNADANRSENSLHVLYSCSNNETAVLDGFTITAGNATGSDPVELEKSDLGAGIYVSGGTPILRNCLFVENRAAGRGAGVYCTDGAAPSLIGCQWQSNRTERGGAVYSDESSPILHDCRFGNNHASFGGAVYAFQGRVNLTDCWFADNKADKDGGALYGHEATTVLIADCQFERNEAVDGWGGAVFNSEDSEPNITGCTFSNNKAPKHSGGALFNNDRATATLVNCRFEANEAKWGGAINNDGHSVSSIADCHFADNKATAGGGAIYTSPHATMTIANSDLLRNKALTGSGGALFNDEDSEADIADCLFSENKASQEVGGAVLNNDRAAATLTHCRFEANQAGTGGAVYNDRDSLPHITDCNFTDNKATGGGGALYAGPQTVLVMAGSDFLRNEALGGSGGALYNDEDSEPNIANCLFSGNKALQETGGAVLNNDRATAILTHCRFEANQAEWAGAINNDRHSVSSIADCNFADNKATIGGGAIYTSRHAAMTVANSDFLRNEALGGSGGALFNDEDSEANIANCLFSGNKALQEVGGAVLNNDRAAATFIRCRFEGNHAATGGAIYSDVDSLLDITDCHFTDNRALNQDGGALCNGLGSRVYLVNCEFLRNRANYTGGVVFNNSCSCSAINCLFAENEATTPGEAPTFGGVMRNRAVDALCEVRFVNCTLAGNKAMVGNALICESGEGGFGSDVRFANCILWDEGAKIEKYDGSTVTIRYSAVAGGKNAAVSPSANLTWGVGNTAADPQFQAGGYRLRPGSPCIDAGDNAAISQDVETDLDGRPRIADGDGDGTPIVDMGAYEHE